MQRVLNTFMLHGRPFEEICRIAKNAFCSALSIEVSQLKHPALDLLLTKYDLSLTGVGAVFLSVDQEDLSFLEEILHDAAAHRAQVVFCVLRPGVSRPDLFWTQAHTLCLRLEELGRKHGICISLEPLSASLRNVSPLCDLSQLLRLCRGKDARWFGWTLDVCHCAQLFQDAELLAQLAPYLRTVHLADLPKKEQNQNQRLFPGEGALPLFHLFAQLRKLQFDGPVELEVISPTVPSMSEDTVTQKIARSFLCTSNCFVVGELAVHCFHFDSSDFTAVGGSAGMVSTQLYSLGIQPLLLGLCGADGPGFWLCENTRSFSFDMLCQNARRTSVVCLDPSNPDRPDIRVGTVEPRQLAARIAQMPDIDAYLYLPYFPGYEEPEIATRSKKNWKRILDFGFYQWCGNYDVLLTQIKRTHPGFCALINAQKMSTKQKLQLGAECVSHGFHYAIITDSTEPVWLISKDSCRAFPIQAAETVRDTCGAGDCMVAGMMAGLCRGDSMDDALSFGITVSKNKVQTYGIWRDSSHGRSSSQSKG